MKTLYFDCFSGISGDMTVAALIDLGVSPRVIDEGLRSLALDGYQIDYFREKKNGIDAQRFSVILPDSGCEYIEEEAHHDHEHSHDQGHEHHHSHDHDHAVHSHFHRGLPEITKIIEESALSERVKIRALAIFNLLAEAEAKVHATEKEKVHFHEVGAVDSIVDIVAASIALEEIGADKIAFSKIREGTGFVNCQHGLIPVPVPATLELMKSCGAELLCTDIPGEMVTPTGAAIAAQSGSIFGVSCPAGKIAAVGYGAGKKNFPHPNTLRVVMVDELEKETGEDGVIRLETNMDDMTGEKLAYVMERLFEEGALDVWFTPITMKKSRPAVMLSCLAPENKEGELINLLFSETSTAGVRKQTVCRAVMKGERTFAQTAFGAVQTKTLRYGSIRKTHVEFESAKKAAMEKGVSLETVYRAAEAASEKKQI